MRLAAAVVSMFLAISSLADAIVYPTGNSGLDVASVREAVRGGGTVLLKATDISGNPRAFEFGEYPVAAINWDVSGSGYLALGTAGEIVPITSGGFTLYVSFGNDVRLLGERTGNTMTTIHGGTIPIRNFAPQMIPGVGVRTVYGIANLTIKGIRFSESALQSIYTYGMAFEPEVAAEMAARGIRVQIEIVGNEFVDVKPQYDFFWYALAAVTDGPAGSVGVEQNRVLFTPGRWDEAERSFESSSGLPPRPEFWEGLSVAELHHPGAVAGNSIEGTDLGVLVYFGGSDDVSVSDNHVHLRPDGSVGLFMSANHRYLIERNTVEASGTNPDGIIIWGDDPVAGINDSTVRHNTIELSGSWFGGISLYGGGRNNYIAQNKVIGSAAYAFGLVSDFAPDAATANAFAGNNISQFTPVDSPFFGSGAHVFFDAHTLANIWVGNSGIAKDLGVNNSITGQTSHGQGPGQQLRDALAAKRELLRRVR